MMPQNLTDQPEKDSFFEERLEQTTDLQQELSGRKNRLMRMTNVKKRKSQDDGFTADKLNWSKGTERQLSLPRMLDVPVRLNNNSLTEAKLVSMGHTESKPKPSISKELSRKSKRPIIHITQHNNNDIRHPVLQRQAKVIVEEVVSVEDPSEQSEDVQEEILPTSPSQELDSENIAKAKHKRRFVLQELMETEQNYVYDVGIIVNGYMEEIKKAELPEGLKGKEKIVFGNIRAILAFHKEKFLPAIEEFHDNPQELGALFTKYEKQLRLYITYCENKPRSEYLVSEFLPVFEKLSTRMKERLQIRDLLIKPVQRIMKYQLLLKDILKYTEKCQEPTISLHKAMDVMHTVPHAANNMMELSRLQGFEIRLPVHGTVLLQESMLVAAYKINKPESRKYKLRRVFLFEQIFIISDLCESALTGHYYKYRNSIKVSELRLVEKVYQEPLSFIISTTSNTKVDTYVQTPNAEVKDVWIRNIRNILDKQTDFLQVLQNPMSSLQVSSDGSSGKVARSKSDRPEISTEHNRLKQNRSKESIGRHRTIH